MTDRSLTAAMAAAVQSTVVRPVLLYEGVFYSAGSPSEQTIRLHSGVGDLTWDGKTWQGAGNLLSISAVDESEQVSAIGFSVVLAGQSPTLISLALQSIRQNKPGKVWLGLMETGGYLNLPGVGGNYASTPDSSTQDITGDIDIRVKAAVADWTPAATVTLAAKFINSGNQRSYSFRLNTNGTLNFLISTTGADFPNNSSSVATGFSDGSAHWVRVTRVQTTGVTTFYTSEDGVTWTQLGSTVVINAGDAIFSSTAEVYIGAVNAGGVTDVYTGKIYRAQIYNGIAGTLAADFDARRFGSADTATMTTGEVWTINKTVPGSPSFDPARIIPEADQMIADPYLLQRGLLSEAAIEDQGETCTIALQYESRLINLRNPQLRRYTPEDQALDYPGDTGFDKVAGLQDMQLIWGGPAAASSPLADPSSAPTDWGSTHDDNTGPHGVVYVPSESYSGEVDNHNE